ncbi:MAG TPA: YbaB/EbfC family nucleoid-associated protein [Candidatus Polarisedimenticolia bacterium]|nr:YbaB/EbfC family nucleoid-associated protein [Candidatus Polarisedimenticolia bacterium]
MDFNAIMKQAQKMQERIQKQMEELRVEGSAGGGMVTVTMSGSRKILAVKISPEVFSSGDAEMLGDLVLAAANVAGQQVDEAMKQNLGGLTGGLKLPGLF